MSLCDGKKQSKQLRLIKSKPDPCHKHGKQILFICQNCLDEPLLCEECIDDHHGHDWVNYEEFFTPEILDIFTSGYSPKAKDIDIEIDHLIDLILDYTRRVEQRLKQLQINIIEGLEKFKNKLPTQKVYEFRGTKIDNRNMSRILQIINNQKSFYNCERLKKTFLDILEVSEENMNNNFSNIENSLQGHHWERVNTRELIGIEKNYISHYKKDGRLPESIFSPTEKNQGIRLQNNRTTAVYINQIPKRPVALIEKPFNSNSNEVVFKIIKLSKTMIFFDASVIYLGVCVPEIAENFHYLNLNAPSKGGYFISSSGRSFHSKLSELDNEKATFNFGEGDEISILIDFKKKIIMFQKKGKGLPIHNKFQMPLSLDDKYIKKLKPCVMFEGEQGAQVAIIYSKTYRSTLENSNVNSNSRRLRKSISRNG